MKAATKMTGQATMRNSWRAANRLLLIAGALFVAFSCGRETSSENVEGETHFLRACDPKTPCGSGLSCVCGVCTISCNEQSACSGLADAARCVSSSERTAAGACVESTAAAVCDLPCTSDEQCSAFSSSHQCANGYCRMASSVGGSTSAGGTTNAGGSTSAIRTTSTGGTTNAGGTASVGGTTSADSVGVAGAAGAAAGAASCPDGQILGNEVVVLGDAMIAQSHQIPAYLSQMARDAGVLAATESFRDYSSASENALALVDTYLAKQFERAQAEGTTKAVVLCGGGADVLAGYCAEPVDASCQILVDAANAAEQLLAQMAQASVQQVIWFFYPDPTSDASARAELDALRPMLQIRCASSSVPCQWIDLRPVFDGHYAEYIRSDGLTPTDAGSQATATAIWDVLKQQCLAR